MRGLQASELHHHEEPPERSRADRDAEVLPLRPQAHPPPGNSLTDQLAARAPARRRRHAAEPAAAAPKADQLETIAARARAGEAEAFSQLVELTSTEIYALALRLVGNEHDAGDVVQETYLRAYNAIARFRGDSSVSTWLYRICANCAMSQRRRTGRRSTELLDLEMPLAEPRGEANPEVALDRSDERAELVRVLHTLPWGLRAVVVLRDIYDLPHEAIAEELGISRTAAKVRLHRARRLLRERLYSPVAQ